MLLKPHILIVDDEEIVRQNFEKILSKEKMEVSVAADGKEAIKQIRKKVFDLILTDMVMEKIDGIKGIGRGVST
jgi:CheY-like chemotaxis protein